MWSVRYSAATVFSIAYELAILKYSFCKQAKIDIISYSEFMPLSPLSYLMHQENNEKSYNREIGVV